MAKILLIDKDDLNVPVTLDLLKSHDVVHFETLAEGVKYLNEKPVELVILEQSLLDKDFAAWLEGFKNDCQIAENKVAKFVVLSHKDDQKWARKIAKAGALDYIIKPIDRPLFLQKMGLITSGSTEKQVYSFGTETAVNVAYEGIVQEISEFGLTLKSDRAIKEGEIITFSSDIFKVEKSNEVLARCYKSDPHPDDRNSFLLKFMFIAVNPAILKQIRSWLRQEYVRKKQQAA
jgi:response regulator RpfG family c-di-GMP phosphodiesterase